MTEKRYYKKDWGESYYVFDSNTISEDEFEERVEYEGYDVFADSLTVSEIIGLLNENEQLKSENKRLKRLTTQYHVIDIEKVLPAIAECKGITVEEYLEEIEEEYTKEGDLE